MNRPVQELPAPGECSVFAQVVIGIDNLATLEELFGEALGEEVWVKVAKRLRPLVPHIADLKQIGQRRIAIGLPGYDPPAVGALVEVLQSAVASTAIDSVEGPVACTISAGCVFVNDEDNALCMDAIMSAALHALHSAMVRGVGSFQTALDDTELLHHRNTLMSASRAALGAIESDHLRIAFQPVVGATGGNTVSFHECLVRILQPSGKLISASAFMPAIERLGMAALIDRQVLMMTFEAMTAEPRARLSVNLFPQTMQDGEWLVMFENAVASDPTLGERLIIEVTEQAAMLDSTRTLRFMDRLREHGVSFALDDFGAGQTSLRYLRDFRFDALKIDGQFVRSVHEDEDCAFFVEKIVEIARRFDMMTIAEHVHSPAAAHVLTTLGVEYFQGFHFGAPNMVLHPTGSPITDLAQQA
jgi:EAL domain-containing protein (putative c-di-GMP-specific phosphodiesterase class I)